MKVYKGSEFKVLILAVGWEKRSASSFGRFTSRESFQHPLDSRSQNQFGHKNGEGNNTVLVGNQTPVFLSLYQMTHSSSSEYCKKSKYYYAGQNAASQTFGRLWWKSVLETICWLLEAQGEAGQWMQVHTRHAVASHLSAVCLSLSLPFSLTLRGCWGNTGPLPGTSHTPVTLILILTLGANSCDLYLRYSYFKIVTTQLTDFSCWRDWILLLVGSLNSRVNLLIKFGT